MRYVSLKEAQPGRKTLETYEKEMRPLLTKLPVYLEEDINLFRIKVHGLKGASRQIGKQEIGDFAEKMEMAVKANDMAFLHSNIDYFLEKLEKVLEEVGAQKAAIPVWKKDISVGKYSAKELFTELKKGFDSYNLTQIENALDCVQEVELDEGQKKLLLLLQEACDELEYEKGSELLREIM